MQILPVLKSADWSGPSTGARVHRWLGTAKEPLVYVAYAWQSNEGLVYATQSEPGDVGDDQDEIVRQSFKNLDANNGSHELVEADGSRLLVAAGQDYAAERILSERHMTRVHAALDADRVVVSIAKRGLLLATAFDGSEQARVTMTNLHREAWVTGADEQITDRLIVMANAVKVDALAVGADGSVADWTP